MPSYTIVEGPARLAARDGLLQTFKPDNPAIPWQGGITYDPEGCGHGGLIAPGCNGQPYPDKSFGCTDPDGDTELHMRPYTVYAGGEVPTFCDRDTARDFTVNAFNRCYDKVIETEFWSGQSAQNAVDEYSAIDLPLYLASEPVVDRRWNPIFPTSADVTDWTGSEVLRPVQAYAAAVQAATAGCNGKAVIHIPQSALTYWIHADLVERIEGRWLTKVGGHTVVAGRGYLGTQPNGSIVPGLSWIYITGQVEVYLGKSSSPWVLNDQSVLIHQQNKRLHIMERQVLPFFDPCVWAGIPMLLCDNACGSVDIVADQEVQPVLNNEDLLPGSLAGIVCSTPEPPNGC